MGQWCERVIFVPVFIHTHKQTLYIYIYILLYLFSIPPPDKYGTRPFFKSGSGRKAAAHTRQVKSKNTFGPVGTPQRGRPRGQETNYKLVVYFFYLFIFFYIYYNTVWLPLSYLVGMQLTKCDGAMI